MADIEHERYFGPEDVDSLDQALNAAWAAFNETRYPETQRRRLAQHILMRAAEGERDPTRLRDYALMKARLRAAWLDAAH